MSISSPHAGVLILLFLATSIDANAAEPSAASHPCTSIGVANERLACYDAAFPPTTTSHSEAVITEDKRTDQLQEFGLNGEQLRAHEPERKRDTRPDRIEAKVAVLSRRRSGERLITLDSGQVWLLTEITSKGPLHVGDPVTIRTAALGSFMLITPARVALRARRIE